MKKLRFIIQDSRKGFTLIELLIVIVIIGILATFLMANFVGIRQRARDAQRKADLRQIQSALELYRADQGEYPGQLPACEGKFCSSLNCEVGVDEVYMQKIPCDPLSNSDNPEDYYFVPGEQNYSYSLSAGLENSNDQQIDEDESGNPIPFSQDTLRWSFTLQNP